MVLSDNVKNREKIIDNLKQELIGPASDFSLAENINQVDANTSKSNFFYYYDNGKQEEVHVGNPQKHYTAGMIYPITLKTSQEKENMDLDNEADITDSDADESESNDTSTMSNVNVYLPATFGITFAAKDSEEGTAVSFSCGIYNQLELSASKSVGRNAPWFRKTGEVNLHIPFNSKKQRYDTSLSDSKGNTIPNIKLRVDVTVREVQIRSTNEWLKIVTINTTNNSISANVNDDSKIMFQCELRCSGLDSGFQPYPSAAEMDAKIGDEDKKFDMLYSEETNYGFGQNCSADWNKNDETVDEIFTTFLPEYEINTMTPDIMIDGAKLKISHLSLATAKNYSEIERELKPLVDGYEQWYLKLKESNVNPFYEKPFTDNLKEIKSAINRIKAGFNLLKKKQVFDIFRLTNLVMLMQMVSGKTRRNIISVDGDIEFDREWKDVFKDSDFSTCDSLAYSLSRGKNVQGLSKYKWRGFQIAFLLMSLESFVEKKSTERKKVDLIWFPTGGGKTEAYLASATFSMLYRRLINPSDVGTDVIMRYTLRLLTADQFQRAARLICSLEYIRTNFVEKFGQTEFSLGMWVGSNNTPNTNTEAKAKYLKLVDGKDESFPLSNCPWCGAQFGYFDDTFYGYKYAKNELFAYCPDENCPFHNSIPVYFVDEQLYKNAPTFLIGTIDKFVQLTWKPEARSLFGIDKQGERILTPPNLIIQDELHLISGPLGTLSGIYESLIEELCTNRRDDANTIPKIICSTATIKSYQQQIQSIFARTESAIFPPSGIDINDNFFSTIQRNSVGEKVPGRKYVGVYPFTQGRLQTEVQVNSSLLTTRWKLPEDQKDPFWTVLSFYNTINDIGKGINLAKQDIPNTINNYYNARGQKANKEKLVNYEELTSRYESDKISLALESLRIPYSKTNNKAMDLVLASNLIEVGVDVDRLALMTINGQPKTTAQYIQVSGRIGRKTDESPGLVVVEYNPNNSNDKSHFEHFNEYHQSLYAQVEESSVTPFSKFAINKGLPAIIIGFLRQAFSLELGEKPIPVYLENVEVIDKVGMFVNEIKKRCEIVDDSESKYLINKVNELWERLTKKEYDEWEYRPARGNREEVDGFMTREFMQNSSLEDGPIPMISSLRSVDSNSKLTIRTLKVEGNRFE